MSKTIVERALIAADVYNDEATGDAASERQGYRYGWVDGYRAGRRDSERRAARKFKLSLRMEKPR